MDRVRDNISGMVRKIVVTLSMVAALAFITWRYFSQTSPGPVCTGAESGNLTVVIYSETAAASWEPGMCADVAEVSILTLAWWVSERPDRERYLHEVWKGRRVEIHEDPLPLPGHDKGAAGKVTPLDLDVQLAWTGPTGAELGWQRVLAALRHELCHIGAMRSLTPDDHAAAVEWAKARQRICYEEAVDDEAKKKCEAQGPDKWGPDHDWFAMRKAPC